MGKCRRAFFYRAFRLFGKEIMSKINNETAALEDGLNKDLPYERCLALGPAVLKDEELLAVILRTGTLGKNATDLAREILKLGRLDSNKSGLVNLANLTLPQLSSIKGVGQVKAIQIQCICELSRRMAKQTAAQKVDFSNPASIADYYMQDLRNEENERLILAMLNTKCKLLADKVISLGTVNSSLINPREIFLDAIRFKAVYIILLHNHPSGDPTPSKEDLLVTKRIMEAGKLLGIRLLDHLVIGDNSYVSLRENKYCEFS